MFKTQTTQTKVDESNRCLDRSWLSEEDEKRFGIANPELAGEQKSGQVGLKPEASSAHYEGMIHIGHQVFLSGDQLVGLTTKLFLNPDGKISHLAVRAARLFGRHKMVPIASVSDVTSLRVQLSIDRDQFKDLPEYQADSTFAEEADRALWKDAVLRDTDYYQIDVQVRDGMIALNGHVITSMNQWRAETAVKNIPGILGVKSYIIPDDKLGLMVSEALGRIELKDNSKIFSGVENGLAVLVGEVSSLFLRDQAEQCVAEIPWVRGVINKISVPGIAVDPVDQRFLQPFIGKELIFKDALSVTVRKVIINPHNRRVIAVVVFGRFPNPLRQGQDLGYLEESSPEQMLTLPIDLILHLTRTAGYLRITSDETTEYEHYDASRYITPGHDWLPPYPYCTDEVLFLAESRYLSAR